VGKGVQFHVSSGEQFVGLLQLLRDALQFAVLFLSDLLITEDHRAGGIRDGKPTDACDDKSQESDVNKTKGEQDTLCDDL
jgi:hypothetical protein